MSRPFPTRYVARDGLMLRFKCMSHKSIVVVERSFSPQHHKLLLLTTIKAMALIYQHDVLCGKDKTYENHAGNRIYRDMITAVAPRYAATPSKQDKMRMTSDIVSTLLTEHGSRFMKRSPVHGGWEEINVAAARDKTSHALRFCAAQIGASVSTKRRSKSKDRRFLASPSDRQRLRRKVSFDECGKKNKCVSPEPTASARRNGASFRQLQAKESYEYNNDHGTENDTTSTWCVPDVTRSVHDLSADIAVDNYQPLEYGCKTTMPFTTTSNIDLDTLWSYQLQDDEEFALIF